MGQTFAAGFWATARVLAAICGAAAALALLLVAIILLAALIGAVFNATTTALARHWKKTGRQPRGRWAKIITESERRANDGRAGKQKNSTSGIS